MDKQYKVHLVDKLPPQDSIPEQKLPIGGFGLSEDDLIYQMVVKNLKEDDHSKPIGRRNKENADD